MAEDMLHIHLTMEALIRIALGRALEHMEWQRERNWMTGNSHLNWFDNFLTRKELTGLFHCSPNDCNSNRIELACYRRIAMQRNWNLLNWLGLIDMSLPYDLFSLARRSHYLRWFEVWQEGNSQSLGWNLMQRNWLKIRPPASKKVAISTVGLLAPFE